MVALVWTGLAESSLGRHKSGLETSRPLLHGRMRLWADALVLIPLWLFSAPVSASEQMV